MVSQYFPFRASLNKDDSIWLIAIALSLSVHFSFFLQRHKQLNAAPATVIQETITHVQFSTLVVPPVMVVEPEIVPPTPKPVTPPEPEVKPQPKPLPKPKPKPLKKKKPIPKPVVKKRQVKPKPPKKTQKPVPVKQAISPATRPDAQKAIQPSPIVAKIDPRLIEQTRMTYHALLMRHIEVHKHYPRVARRRKIQGEIMVSFTLLKDGLIKNLLVNGKKSILKKASQSAIANALPMPSPPKELSLPMEVKFTMNYFLK